MKKSLIVFLATTFGATWLVCLIMYMSGLEYGSPAAVIITALIMFIPALSSIFTRIVTREGFSDMRLSFRLRDGGFRFFALAWLIPPAATVFGAALYFLIYPEMLDMSGALVGAEAQIRSLGAPAFLSIMLAQAVILAPVLNFVPSLGEELGWRGYMLYKLDAMMPRRAAVIVSGVIWGLWHAPLIAMGHNYGVGYASYPWGGILAMIIFCVFVGAFFAFLTFRTNSVIPASIAHGALNGIASVGLVLCSSGYNAFIGPTAVGIIGGFGFVIVGIACLMRAGKE